MCKLARPYMRVQDEDGPETQEATGVGKRRRALRAEAHRRKVAGELPSMSLSRASPISDPFVRALDALLASHELVRTYSMRSLVSDTRVLR
jgi:hypothetical protein